VGLFLNDILTSDFEVPQLYPAYYREAIAYNGTDYYTLTSAALQSSTDGACKYMTPFFEENMVAYNTTRWNTTGQLAFCSDPTTGAPTPHTCTYMSGSDPLLQWNQTFDDYSASYPKNVGARLSLNQSNCYDDKTGANLPECCGETVYGGRTIKVCAGWMGAQLMSNWCQHFGVLEVQSTFFLEPEQGAAFRIESMAANCIGSGCDSSWNEVTTIIAQNTTNTTDNSPVWASRIAVADGNSWMTTAPRAMMSTHDATGACNYNTSCACSSSASPLSANCM
jgi:hypothetical protein